MSKGPVFDDKLAKTCVHHMRFGLYLRQWTLSILLCATATRRVCRDFVTPLHADINSRSITSPIICGTNESDVKPDISRVTLRRGMTTPNKWLQSAGVLPPPMDSPGNSLINIWVTRANSHCQGLRLYRSDATMDTVRCASDAAQNKEPAFHSHWDRWAFSLI